MEQTFMKERGLTKSSLWRLPPEWWHHTPWVM